MKIGAVCSGRGQRAVMLIECLVYMAVFVVLLGLGSLALYRGLDNMRALHRNADDIARALNAGEIWRNDIRSATGPIQLVRDSRVIEIPHARGEISYKFADAQVLRKAGSKTAWTVLLPKVQSSQMTVDTRQYVTAWHWELELQTSSRASIHIHPLFTFFAVPHPMNQL
jgi:hypothetical protein